jgi:hypothetical protein
MTGLLQREIPDSFSPIWINGTARRKRRFFRKHLGIIRVWGSWPHFGRRSVLTTWFREYAREPSADKAYQSWFRRDSSAIRMICGCVARMARHDPRHRYASIGRIVTAPPLRDSALTSAVPAGRRLNSDQPAEYAFDIRGFPDEADAFRRHGGERDGHCEGTGILPTHGGSSLFSYCRAMRSRMFRTMASTVSDWEKAAA